MAHYRVGLRVKVIYAPAAPEVVGVETKITGERTWFGMENWELGCTVPTGGHYWCPKKDAGLCLVPILDGDQPCEEEFKQELDKLLDEQPIIVMMEKAMP